MMVSAIDHIKKTDGVWAVYVFKRSGELVAKDEQRFKASMPMQRMMGNFLFDLLKGDAKVTEVTIFYQEAMLFFKTIEDNRAIAIVADPRTVPSLLRVTLDVALNRT